MRGRATPPTESAIAPAATSASKASHTFFLDRAPARRKLSLACKGSLESLAVAAAARSRACDHPTTPLPDLRRRSLLLLLDSLMRQAMGESAVATPTEHHNIPRRVKQAAAQQRHLVPARAYLNPLAAAAAPLAEAHSLLRPSPRHSHLRLGNHRVLTPRLLLLRLSSILATRSLSLPAETPMA